LIMPREKLELHGLHFCVDFKERFCYDQSVVWCVF